MIFVFQRLPFLMFFGLAFGWGTFAIADDALKPSELGKSESSKVDSAPEDFDPTVIPEGGLPELMQFVRRCQSWQPKIDAAMRKDPEAMKKVQAQMAASRGKLLEAADKALALNPEPESRLVLIRAKWSALRMKGMLGDQAAEKAYDESVAALLADSDERIAREAYKVSLLARLSKFMNGKSQETPQALATEITVALHNDAKRDDAMSAATTATAYFEMRGHYDVSKALYNEMLTEVEKLKDDKIQKAVRKRVENGLARLDLVGRPAELTGKHLDGTDFDIKSLRGKVVLIEFWATWCGPCILEMPHVAENYKKYHDRGFEVVGISLDDDKEKLEKFLADSDRLNTLIHLPEVPWKLLFNEDQETRGFADPTAKKYFVNGIPATYLVDKSGNLIHLSVRGSRLGQLLEELLGE